MIGDREAPPEVLERLREIDPTADLIYVGGGEWMLGAWWPKNRHRWRTATKLLEEQRKAAVPAAALRDGPEAVEAWLRMRARRQRLYELFRDGFRPIDPDGDCPIAGELGYRTEHDFGAIVEEFRAKDYRLQNAEKLFEAALDRATENPDAMRAKATMLDYLGAESRSDHRIHMRHRVSINNPRNWKAP